MLIRFTALLLLLLSSVCLAQTELEGYLRSTDPILTRIAQLNQDFLDTIPPLQKKRDLLAMQAAATKWEADWSELKTRLSGLSAPAEVATYHASLTRMVEVQAAGNGLLLQTMNDGLALTAEIKAMKAAGATLEAMEARIAEFKTGKEALAREVEAYRNEAVQLDETLKVEREKLGSTKS